MVPAEPAPTASQDTGVNTNAGNPDQQNLVQNVAPEQDLLQRIVKGFRFPELQSKHIKQYEKWNSKHPTYLVNLFARAEPFLFYIVEEIEKRGLPTEIALLPAVESAFKPNAVSRSGAGGLWQFVPSTARHFGLRQDGWYDGRRDLVAATNAALDYLEQLNTMFDGDWFLTLAAYNAGPGTVQRAIKANNRRHRSTRYQKLKLRKETRRYVPKLIALKNIISNPDKYGVVLPTIENKEFFVSSQLPRQIDLHKLAAETKINLPRLQNLNAGFLRWATPPDGPYRLLIPVADSARVTDAINMLSLQPQIQYRNHNIRNGDTLSSIAKRYGVSVSALKSTNKMGNSSIRAGHNLLIPIAEQPPITSTIEQQTGSANGHLTPSNQQLTHRVVAGDTLWSIARRYQVRVAQLLSWNKLSANQVLSLDQVLTVFIN